jgi:hypothetical protein
VGMRAVPPPAQRVTCNINGRGILNLSQDQIRFCMEAKVQEILLLLPSDFIPIFR